MAKQKQKSNKADPAVVVTTAPTPPSAAPVKFWYWVGAVLLITFICYIPIFSDQKEFTNWDDPGYVLEQPLVKSLDLENIKAIFNPKSAVMFNYHPLTMLSLAVDYKLGYDAETKTLSIAPFVFSNFILHLLNTALVFIFLYRLGKKRIWLATIGALLFGIHPMHVESVAWISERKDVLYCLFFLLSCISYLKYLDSRQGKFLLFTFLFFIASCLSKAMAVPLPFVLLLTDYLYNRKIDAKAWLEKMPFIALSLIIGWYTVIIQKKAIGDYDAFTLAQRFMYASFGFFMYLLKLLVPFNLSAYYAYPVPDAAGKIPFIYYVSPVFAVLILLIPVWVYLKKRQYFRHVMWGLGFYALMIALVLQFVSVGQAMMAERYSYVSYIGPIFLVSFFVTNALEDQRYEKIALSVSGCALLIYGFLTFQRIQIWENSRTYWTSVIDRYPDAKSGYKNLGDYYASHKSYDTAYVFYNYLVLAGTKDPEVWSNMGNIHMFKNDIPAALNDYSKSLSYDSANYETYMKRGVLYSKQGKNDDAVKDMNTVIRLKPDFEDAYVLRAKSLLKEERFEDAVAACTAGISKFPSDPEFNFLRGAAFINLKKYDEGIKDMQRAIQLNPKSPLYYYNLASAYAKTGNKPLALQNAQTAQQMGFPVSPDFIKEVSQ